MNETIIKTSKLTKFFQKKAVFSNLNLSVNRKNIFVISGASGCGKTTLLNIISSLDNNYDGEVMIDGKNTKSMSLDSLAKFRNAEVGIVFQNHNLLPEFTILENICIPLYISKIDKKQADLRAKETMDLLGIEDCSKSFPNEVSGGQAQRAAFARAIINNPKVIFADEPTGSLDEKNSENIRKIILDLREKMNFTFVISTHCTKLMDIADQNFRLTKYESKSTQNT